MKKLIAIVLYAALVAGFLFGQTRTPGGAAGPLTNPLVDHLERMSKRFPAELLAPAPGPAKLSRSYCVTRAGDAPITMQPCQRQIRKLRLLPAFQTGAAAKP
jgi:hypothetical protein